MSSASVDIFGLPIFSDEEVSSVGTRFTIRFEKPDGTVGEYQVPTFQYILTYSTLLSQLIEPG